MTLLLAVWRQIAVYPDSCDEKDELQGPTLLGLLLTTYAILQQACSLRALLRRSQGGYVSLSSSVPFL